MRLPLLLLLVVVSVIHAFQPATPAGPRNPLVARRRGHLAGGLYATTPKASEEPSTTTAEVDVLKGAAMLDLCLEQHRPLGCTVEEALGKGYEKLVFVSKIVPGGCAAQAGIQVGDVVVGVSSLLGDDGMEDVARAGIDRV
jgi:S1-C subfamily serine protease